MNSTRIREAVDLILACSTVILFYVSFPGGHSPWLGWLALVPLGLAIHGKNAQEAFIVTAFTSFLCWFAATWWLIPGVSLSANTPPNIALFFEFIFCLAYAVPYGIAGLFVAKMGWTGTIRGAIMAALLWTAISGLTPHILPGNMAHTQYRYTCMIQIVELGGIPLLLFFMYLVMWLCVVAAVNFKRRPKYALWALLLAGMVPLGVAAYGQCRLKTIHQRLAAPETPKITVGWIQPNFTIHGRNRSAWGDGGENVAAMTRDLARKKPAPDLIVWPEIPLCLSYTGNAGDRALVDQLVAETKIPMLVTGRLQAATEEDGYYNTAELVTEHGDAEIYRKQHLLPFGEYLPGEKRFPIMRQLFPNVPNYIPGDGSKVFFMDSGIGLIPLICYEAVFPSMVASGSAMGGNLVINPVNDGWFGNSAGPEIHLALALFRAVEFRMPVVRATNSGIGAVVTAAGELDDASITPLFEQCAVSVTVAIPPLSSWYATTGDLFLWGCALASLFFLGVGMIKRFRLH